MKKISPKFTLITALIALAVVSRLLPHPPNFAPITGIALFAAHRFSNTRIVYLLPLACLFLTDLVLGLSWINVAVYSAFIGITWLGTISKSVNVKTILFSSVFFFLWTNLAVWGLYYPKTIEGLTQCFVLAIPFFTNTLLGDLFFTGVLFFSFSTLTKRYPILNT